MVNYGKLWVKEIMGNYGKLFYFESKSKKSVGNW